MPSHNRLAPLLFTGLVLLQGCNGLRAIFPRHSHDDTPPDLPAGLGQPGVLLFTKTNGFRHHEAIEAGVGLFEEIAARRGWSVFHTENGAVFNRDQLARFAVTVWHNTSGDTLDKAQQRVLRSWIEGGGGFVAIHGAGGDFAYDEWPWYVETLIGAQFIGHTVSPQFQEAEVATEVRDHPATRHLPSRWTHTEEWYSFEASPRGKGVTVLLSVDERSYTPEMNIPFMDEDIAMGDHPVVWHHCVGRGRTLFSALGHQAEAYATEEVAGLLEGAVVWAARLAGVGCD